MAEIEKRKCRGCDKLIVFGRFCSTCREQINKDFMELMKK